MSDGDSLGGVVHYPMRGSAVECWLKRERNELPAQTTSWFVLDDLLDRYRLAADTGEVWINRA